jgi:hypothetical protein
MGFSMKSKIQLILNWAKEKRYFIILILALISFIFLWFFKNSIELFLPVLINIAALVLGTFISLSPAKKQRLKIIIWVVVFFITLGNFYLHLKEQEIEKPYYDILSPNITAMEAFDFAKDALDIDLKIYQLIDIIGSYYIFMKKPDTFFHKFPEWVLIFKNMMSNEILEVRISDGRMPPLPYIKLDDFNSLYDGKIAMHMKFTVNLAYLGADIAEAGDTTDVVVIFDNYARSLIEIRGKSPYDSIPEVVESLNSKVFARIRSVGRATDYCKNFTVIESPIRLGKVVICSARFPADDFYKSLNPIVKWKIDVEKAIEKAIAAGAKAIPPGKFAHSGGPGLFRLNSSKKLNLHGFYWQIPFRVKISPILISAENGDVFTVDQSGNYNKK